MIKRPLDKLDADSFAIKIEHSGIHFYIKVGSGLISYEKEVARGRKGGRREEKPTEIHTDRQMVLLLFLLEVRKIVNIDIDTVKMIGSSNTVLDIITH